ncbi:MAG: 50S ribosomal protein L24 [Nanoarchaeota archaeon]
MKEYSASWNSSRSKRKQRKFRFNAPLHTRHKLMSSQVSKEIEKKESIKTIPVRKGDEVRIMIGKFRGQIGKVKSVDTKKLRVTIDKMQRQKKDGTKIDVYFHPSNLQIKTLVMDDKKRIKNKKETPKEAKTENKTGEKK